MLEKFLELYRKPFLSQKLVISYLFLTLTATGLLSYLFFQTAETALIDRTLNQLSSIRVLKKGWLENFFQVQKREIDLFSAQKEVTSFIAPVNKKKQKDATTAKYTIDPDLYKNTYNFIESNGYKNLWFFNKRKELVYEYTGTNSSDTLLNDFYKMDVFSISDSGGGFFEETCPATERRIFYISNIFNENKERVGHIIVMIPLDKIFQILAQYTGMGATGESYVVGDDTIMKSRSRFYQGSYHIKVNTVAVKNAINGKEGMELLYDYRNKRVLSAYSPLNIHALNWVIISEIDLEEAMAPIYTIRQKLLYLVFGISLAVLIVTLILSDKISSPIVKLKKVIDTLSKGILPEKMPTPKSEDEIGQMVLAINKLIDGIYKTSDFAYEIGKGNFKASFTPLSDSDVLGLALLEMRDKLVKYSKLVEEQNKLKTLALIEGQENERRRISRDLHDGVGQMLTALKFKIQELNGDTEIIKELKHLLDETIQEVRRVSVNLMPSALWDFGLEAALKILIRNSGLDVNFSFEKGDNIRELGFEERICLYRIAQESLQNVLKYAGDKKVNLFIVQEEDEIKMRVEDFGAGFDPKNYLIENKSSHGLSNMKERINILGGSFKVSSEKGKGTKILVKLPL